MFSIFDQNNISSAGFGQLLCKKRIWQWEHLTQQCVEGCMNSAGQCKYSMVLFFWFFGALSTALRLYGWWKWNNRSFLPQCHLFFFQCQLTSCFDLVHAKATSLLFTTISVVANIIRIKGMNKEPTNGKGPSPHWIIRKEGSYQCTNEYLFQSMVQQLLFSSQLLVSQRTLFESSRLNKEIKLEGNYLGINKEMNLASNP